MAKRIFIDPATIHTDDPVFIKKGDGVLATEGTGTNMVSQGNSTVPIYIGGKYAGYTVKNIDPTRGVEVIVDDSGNTKWLPYNVNERLVPYLDANGQLDLLGAVSAGIKDPQDYANWQVTEKQIKDAETISKYIENGQLYAQKAYDDGVSLEIIQIFASDFVPQKNEPTDDLPTDTDVKYNVSDALKPYIVNGQLDIVKAVSEGITDPKAYEGVEGITAQDIKDLSTLLKYRQDNGSFNISQAIRDGVDEALIKNYFDIDDKTLQEVKEIPNVETLSNAKTSPEIAKYDKYINNGSIDLISATRSLSDKELQELGVSDNSIRLARLANKYTGEDGLFDVIKAVDDNVSDGDLIQLGFTDKAIQQAKDAKELTSLGLSADNFSVTEAIKAGASDDLLKRLNVPDQTIDDAKKYLRLEKYYGEDGKTSIASAKEQGASEQDLLDMGFTYSDIQKEDRYDTAIKEINANYLDKDGNIDTAKLYKEGKLSLLVDVNDTITGEQLAEITDFYKNHTLVGNVYLTNDDIKSLTNEMDSIGLTAKEKVLLVEALSSGDFDSYSSALNKAREDKYNELFVMNNAGEITDYNYDKVNQLAKDGKLDSFLTSIGVQDVSEWKELYNDYNTIQRFVNTQNTINRKTDGKFEDYVYSASQNVLDAYNRVYGTDLQFGKYNEITSQGISSVFKYLAEHPKEIDDYLGYDVQVSSSNIPKTLSGLIGEKGFNVVSQSARIQQSINPLIQNAYAISKGADWLAKKFNVEDDNILVTIADGANPDKGLASTIGKVRDGVIELQEKITGKVHDPKFNFAEEQVGALANELVVNDILLDPATIILSGLEGSIQARTDGKKGAENLASLGITIAMYPLTIPGTFSKNKTQGIAEAASILVPGAKISGGLKTVGKATSTATFGKISDIAKAVNSAKGNVKSASKTSYNLVIKGDKTAKTSTLPIATGKFAESKAVGFNPDGFGKVTDVGSVFDGSGKQIGFTEYKDKAGNITVLLNPVGRTKWDVNANKVMWDTIKNIKSDKTVSVVYGNQRITANASGVKLAKVDGGTVKVVQTSKNLDAKNGFTVTKNGVQIAKTGKDAPLIVYNEIKSKDVKISDRGAITTNNKTRLVETVTTDKKAVRNIYAKTAKQITKIIIDPRFSKTIIKEAKAAIGSKIPATAADNYKAMKQLEYALKVMDPKDAKKVMEWAEIPTMKKLLKEGRYAEFVQMIGLDKVDPEIRSKEDFDKMINPESEKISKPLLDKLNKDLSVITPAMAAKYENSKKTKQTIAKAVIPVLLATKLAMPVGHFDVKYAEGPKIVLVQDVNGKIQTKITDTDTKTDKISDTKKTESKNVKSDISPKLDKDRLSKIETTKQTKSNIKSPKVSNSKIDNTRIDQTVKTTASKVRSNIDYREQQKIQKQLKQESADMQKTIDTVKSTKTDVPTQLAVKQNVKDQTKQTTDQKVQTKQDVMKQMTEQQQKVQDRIQNKQVVTNKIVNEKIQNQTVIRENIRTTPKVETPKLNRRPGFPKVLKIKLGSDDGNGSGKEKALGTVVVAWRQGSLKINGRSKPVWIVVRKKGSQLVRSYEYKAPEGANVTKGKPYQTLFHRGKKIRPFKVRVGFNNVTVDLTKAGKDQLMFQRVKLPTQRQISTGRR